MLWVSLFILYCTLSPPPPPSHISGIERNFTKVAKVVSGRKYSLFCSKRLLNRNRNVHVTFIVHLIGLCNCVVYVPIEFCFPIGAAVSVVDWMNGRRGNHILSITMEMNNYYQWRQCFWIELVVWNRITYFNYSNVNCALILWTQSFAVKYFSAVCVRGAFSMKSKYQR